MTPSGRYSRQRGITWLEAVLSLALLLVFAALLLDRMENLQAEAERTMVQTTIMNLRSGLRLQVAERLVRGRMAELKDFPGANPVAWMEKPPDGYLGELWGPPAPEAKGCWYFDREHGELAYRPRASVKFAGEAGEDGEIRWRVRATTGSGKVTEGSTGKGSTVPEGITIDISMPKKGS